MPTGFLCLTPAGFLVPHAGRLFSASRRQAFCVRVQLTTKESKKYLI